MHDSKSSPGIPFPTIFLALSGVLGTIFSQIDFESSRPPQPSNLVDNVPGHQDILARLWEDPFEAIDRYNSSTPEEDRASATELDLSQSEKKKISKVFIAFVRGGPYAEDREHRMRTRLALHYAMSDEDYIPIDNTHRPLGNRSPTGPRDKHHPPLRDPDL